MTKIAAIHQPNFFPWLGFFDKIARSDVFVLLDNVQFPKTGGSWTNRVKLIIGGEVRWLTASIDRSYHGTKQILEMEFVNNERWKAKMIGSLQASYGRCEFYGETMTYLLPLIENPETNIAGFNINAIKVLCSQIGLDTSKFVTSSELAHHGMSNELLCSLTLNAGCTAYMCGGGADSYQNEDVFSKNGIKLLRQNFMHPRYVQREQTNFVPGLSIIDSLMNIGCRGVRDLLITA